VTPAPRPRPTTARVHAIFLTALPRFQAHAEFAFRHVRCEDARADLAAEAIALAWRAFARLARRGRNPQAFVTTLARRCTQAVRSGRRLAGSSAADVLSPVAAARHHFTVARLGGADPLADALSGNAVTPVPDQTAFRVDFPRWRAGIRARDRRVLDALMLGGRTGEVADRFGLSPARVSQLRRAFAAGWADFQHT
jgi:DNA-directed RNA polymerase specialized sigma24 family protein